MGFLIFWILCGVIAAMIAAGKGSHPAGYAILGFILGPIGIIMALLMSGETCAFCGKRISKDASICPYCQHQLKPIQEQSKQNP